MDNELEAFLNSLGEAERAGGRVLHELTEQAQSLELREMLRKVGHDEGYYAGELAAHVRRLGGSPSNKSGFSSIRCAPLATLRESSNCSIAGSDGLCEKLTNRSTVSPTGTCKHFCA